jgi:hypothetical protein
MEAMKTLILFLLLTASAFAQSHNVTLTWTDTVNPTGTTYNAWRQTGTCPTTAPTTTTGFTQLNSSAISLKSYSDTTVTGGTTYCYIITALGTTGSQSAPSNDAQAIVPGAFPPTGLTVTAN